MPVTLHIPDSIASGLRLPEAEIEPRLRLELALALYSQAILSFGKASELAGINRYPSMLVVSDTSPLSNLAIIGRLGLVFE